MKKMGIVLGLIATICLGACRKDRTCTCRDQRDANTYHIISNSTISDAKNICNNFESHPAGGATYTNCSIE